MNLLPLIWFKYAAPASDTVAGLAVVAGMLLGLSFYAFQQITALFDSRGPDAPRLSLAGHALFVSFFAQVPSGPISRYRDLAPQIAALGTRRVSAEAVLVGLSLFVFGIVKQHVVAGYLADGVIDPVAVRIDAGTAVSALDAWALGWGFLVQLYFDFSGYSDMALGLAACFGLALPVNFASPLKARSASQFVDRWHISLVAWVREYLSKPVFQAVSRRVWGRAERRRVVAWAVATVASMTALGAARRPAGAAAHRRAECGVPLVVLQLRPLRRSAPARLGTVGGRIALLATLSVLGLALRVGGLDRLGHVRLAMVGGGPPPAPTAPTASLGWDWEDLVATSTTQFSLRVFRPAPPETCAPPGRPDYLKVDFSPAHVAKVIRAIDRYGIDAVLSAFASHCGAGHHRLVLVPLPMFVSRQARQYAEATVASHGRWLRDRVAQTRGRTVTIHDTASNYIRRLGPDGARRADWWDTSHFRPALGERLLGDSLPVTSSIRPECRSVLPRR